MAATQTCAEVQTLLGEVAPLGCKSPWELELAELAYLNRVAGQYATVTQVQKAMTTASALILAAPAAGTTRKFVTIQNVGANPCCIRTAASASSTAANGEWILKGGTGALDGAGGFITLDGYSGVLYGATTTSTTNLSVSYADIT